MNFQSQQNEITDCDREPIHRIGHIQGFGCLIAVDHDWAITHFTANCSAMLETTEEFALGQALIDHFNKGAIADLRSALSRIVEDDTSERLFGVSLTGSDSLFDCAIHPSGERIIIEIEPHIASTYEDHLAAFGPMTKAISNAPDVESLCSTTAQMVRKLLGYDRVMVYRFHSDESGEVVAEDKDEALESFLGLRYPRTDIPQQARRLFTRNRFRIIADMDATPVPIEPALSRHEEALDLSLSTLRAHSPVHTQYMKNMGVQASLSIAIVRAGRLWGLISCHHNTPRTIPFSQRTVAEVLSQMFSLMLDRLLVEHSEGLQTRSLALHDKLMRRFADGVSFVEDLDMFESVLEELISHDGTSVLIHDKYRSRGAAPDEEQFAALLPGLSLTHERAVLSTHCLAAQIHEANAFANVASGALILPISRSPRDYLVLWRKPLVQTVHWAGNPAKAIASSSGKLEPRNSFKVWAETVEGLSEEWSDDDLAIAEGLRSTLLEVILRMTDEVANERKRAQEKQDLLIAELNHRVRNILNLIRALVSQSTKDAINVSDFASIIGGRIAALASAHDNITRQHWAPAPLASLFETELEAYVAGKNDRLHMTGDPVLIQPEAYTVLALVVHELVTNSAKYGSLCDSCGTIKVDISQARNGDLLVNWRERGGPPVQPPTRKGFGSTIITRAIPYDLRGEAQMHFKLSGLEAEFRIPARFVARQSSEAAATAQAASNPEHANENGTSSPSLPGHVLLVEDNMIIALDTEDTLIDLGVKSVRVEGTVGGALAAISERQPEFAIVDFNLGSESSAKVTDELAARGVPFVLATGYSELASDLGKLGACGIIRKPYGMAEIEQALLGESQEEEAVTKSA